MDHDETLHDTHSPPPRGGGPRTAALVLALECERPLAAPIRLSLAEVDEVLIGRGGERSQHRFEQEGRRVLRVNVPNGWMSSLHTRIARGEDGWSIADAGSKNGTFVDGAQVDAARLRGGELIEAGRAFFLFLGATEPGDLAAGGDGIETLHPGLRRELERLARVAASDLPVLVLGETGTGKELAARAVHERSGRSGAFVDVNCGALPEELIESELFGHRKGAFSGAGEDRIGLIRSADGGTLFLDEIAELAPASQVALLRVLQEQEVRPVGDSKAVAVDVRVVAATLQDLPARVAEGQFRQDLYARLAGFTLQLPALRERREDIGLLAGALLRRALAGSERSVRFTRAAARALFTHSWPLNVRELEHALRSALALAEGDEIDLAHLPAAVRGALDAPAPPPPAPPLGRDQTLNRQLAELLREHRGNVSAVARAMGKAPMQVYRWLKRFGIDVDAFREP